MKNLTLFLFLFFSSKYKGHNNNNVYINFSIWVLIGGLDKPTQRPYIEKDWRFGHYEMEGLQDPLSRLSRCLLRPLSFSLKKKRKSKKADSELVLQPLELSVWLPLHNVLLFPSTFPLKLGLFALILNLRCINSDLSWVASFFSKKDNDCMNYYE